MLKKIEYEKIKKFEYTVRNINISLFIFCISLITALFAVSVFIGYMYYPTFEFISFKTNGFGYYDYIPIITKSISISSILIIHVILFLNGLVNFEIIKDLDKYKDIMPKKIIKIIKFLYLEIIVSFTSIILQSIYYFSCNDNSIIVLFWSSIIISSITILLFSQKKRECLDFFHKL
jgi:hypothetical protein